MVHIELIHCLLSMIKWPILDIRTTITIYHKLWIISFILYRYMKTFWLTSGSRVGHYPISHYETCVCPAVPAIAPRLMRIRIAAVDWSSPHARHFFLFSHNRFDKQLFLKITHTCKSTSCETYTHVSNTNKIFRKSKKRNYLADLFGSTMFKNR